MSTTINLNTAVLCQYKTGTLGPYTITESNTRVVGSIHWTHKDNKISFYFKATQRLANSYYNSQKGFIWYGNQEARVRLKANAVTTSWRQFVRQNSASQVTGYSAEGYQNSPGTYDQTPTITFNAVSSTISLTIQLNSSDTASQSASYTPSTVTMVSTAPSIEYYRSGANVLARVKCVTTRSSTAYSDNYTYKATLTIAGKSQSVTLSIPATNTSTTSTSSWLTVQSTANSLSATVDISSTNGGGFSKTQTATLSVPAMSSISGASTGTLGSDYTINITRYDSSFKDTLTYYINGTLIDTIASNLTGSTSSYTWSAPPVSLASYAPNTTSVVVTIRCTTASGSTTIGSTDISVTMQIPLTVTPTLGTVTLTPINSNTTVDGWGIYLQGYSQCKIDVVGSTGAYGSTIVSYSARVGSITVTGSASSGNANWSGTSPIITVSGSIQVGVQCTDSRGRTSSEHIYISIKEYNSPTISNATVFRTGSSGTTEIDDGTYIYAYAKLNYSNAGNNNTASMSVKYRAGTSGSYTSGGNLPSETGTRFGGGNISVASSWEVVITATDALSNTNEYVFQLSTGMASLHIRSGGTGICLGGYSQHDDSVAIGDGMAMLLGNGVIVSSLPATGIAGQIVFLGSSGRYAPYMHNGTTWVGIDLNEVQYQIYSSVTSLGLTSGSATIAGVYAAMPDGSILITTNGEFASGECPSNGLVEIHRRTSGRSAIFFYGATDSNHDYRMFLNSNYVPSGTWVRSDLAVESGTPTASSGTISSTAYVKRSGNTVVLEYAASSVSIPTTLTKIGAIPSKFVPSETVFGIGLIGFGAATPTCYAEVTTDGDIRVRGTTAQNSVAFRTQLTWIQ